MAHGARHYRLEAVYSLLTWLRIRRAGVERGGSDFEPCDALVVTDAPEDFTAILGGANDVPEVRYLPVNAAQLTQWQGGPDGYVHRIKPLAMRHAADAVGAAPADVFCFIDSDTAFLADPAPLLARVAAGAVVLHEREGTIAGNRRHTRSQGRLYQAARAGRIPAGAGGAVIDAAMPLWNSGVIGLRGDQLGVLDETVELIDRMTATLRLTTAEQVALAAVLRRRGLEPEPAAGFVHHYYLFKEFRQDLAAFFDHHRGASLNHLLAAIEQIDPVRRGLPKMAFNRQPKVWRQIRKAVGRSWKPLVYPWQASETADRPA